MHGLRVFLNYSQINFGKGQQINNYSYLFREKNNFENHKPTYLLLASKEIALKMRPSYWTTQVLQGDNKV